MMHSALAWRFKSCSSTDSEPEQLLDVIINVSHENALLSKRYNQGGLELLHRQRFAEALANFEEAQKLDPLSSLVRQNKAVALYFLGRFSEALQSCESAMDYYPSSSNLSDSST
jgi:tetratricopeptide (TPR) repeat protein